MRLIDPQIFQLAPRMCSCGYPQFSLEPCWLRPASSLIGRRLRPAGEVVQLLQLICV